MLTNDTIDLGAARPSTEASMLPPDRTMALSKKPREEYLQRDGLYAPG
jgi:hypothetical protein